MNRISYFVFRTSYKNEITVYQTVFCISSWYTRIGKRYKQPIFVFRTIKLKLKYEIRKTSGATIAYRISFVLTSVNYGKSPVMESRRNQKTEKNCQLAENHKQYRKPNTRPKHTPQDLSNMVRSLLYDALTPFVRGKTFGGTIATPFDFSGC